MTDEQRFWSKVRKSDACWQWGGSDDGKGYGKFWMRRKFWMAHRVAYEWARGAIPEGMEIDHLCRNRGCVNPAHLEVVTHTENVMRTTTSPHAINRAKASCPSGHPYDGTGRRSDGTTFRRCKACKREQDARYRARCRAMSGARARALTRNNYDGDDA